MTGELDRALKCGIKYDLRTCVLDELIVELGE